MKCECRVAGVRCQRPAKYALAAVPLKRGCQWVGTCGTHVNRMLGHQMKVWGAVTVGRPL